jgi:hypothetical protein
VKDEGDKNMHLEGMIRSMESRNWNTWCFAKFEPSMRTVFSAEVRMDSGLIEAILGMA